MLFDFVIVPAASVIGTCVCGIVIANHLAGALTAAGEPAELVNEAVGVVAPLRDVFKRNAEEFRAQTAQAKTA